MNRTRTTVRNVAQLVALWLVATVALLVLLFVWLALPNLGKAIGEPAQQPIHPTSARSA
ncbi:hypothetical protein [Burkholderia gladioli]|uniref:hypothetical protein n=1 Tax=Burkholderia gladioli TaxID=28095 RepID=UPI0034DAE40C